MEGKQKSHVINKDKGPQKLRRKEGKLLKAGKMLTSSAQEEKIMVNKLSKACPYKQLKSTQNYLYSYILLERNKTIAVKLVISYSYGQKGNFLIQ